MFNTILVGAGLNLADVRLLRHKVQSSAKGHSPYELWRDHRTGFDTYQSIQSFENRNKLQSPYWAAFVGTPSDQTLFIGLFTVKNRRVLDIDTPRPDMEGIDKAGSKDFYDLSLESTMEDLIGRLFIDWGAGVRSWIQYASRQDKKVTELNTAFKEPEFPGFLNFMEPLSKLENLPKDWATALQHSKGIYLLTCPKTKEQYVGSATGEQGFWQRWQDYALTGHGGDVALKSREPSDYQVSILEVAGTAATPEDILAMEIHWKKKLQSREMGLNRN
jgi:GIY-YIG catalytic domain